jgi:hypothetical protein
MNLARRASQAEDRRERAAAEAYASVMADEHYGD